MGTSRPPNNSTKREDRTRVHKSGHKVMTNAHMYVSCDPPPPSLTLIACEACWRRQESGRHKGRRLQL